jgi:tRNA A-37 threonylcarbamoyl transferase component Bud32
MASTLDNDFNKLNRIVEKYCINGKEEDAIECIEWARGYADDFPQDEDIREAMRLVKKAGRYITEEGKPQYEQVQEKVEKRLGNLLKKR